VCAHSAYIIHICKCFLSLAIIVVAGLQYCAVVTVVGGKSYGPQWRKRDATPISYIRFSARPLLRKQACRFIWPEYIRASNRRLTPPICFSSSYRPAVLFLLFHGSSSSPTTANAAAHSPPWVLRSSVLMSVFTYIYKCVYVCVCVHLSSWIRVRAINYVTKSDMRTE
jgi:hypothetical protein